MSLTFLIINLVWYDVKLFCIGCFAWFVFLVSCDGCVALPRGAIGLSAVCDRGISWLYSLFLLTESKVTLIFHCNFTPFGKELSIG